MIVKIKLLHENGETSTMLFGNSYKNWSEQFAEYCRSANPIKVVFVETSKADWMGWGGLKWCAESEFQGELNREGCQSKDPDNPSPRLYDSMVFNDNRIVYNQVVKMVRDRVLARERYEEKVRNEPKPDYGNLKITAECLS